jgi:CRISPR-associated protein Cmr4
MSKNFHKKSKTKKHAGGEINRQVQHVSESKDQNNSIKSNNMNKIFYTVKCKTNMHVGSGKANYGVVDQLVQRDPTFQYPTIHASSLKGAIKEYCHGLDNFNFNMKEVFGSDKTADGKTDHDTSQIGAYKFFDASLLAIPVRCDKRAFVHITCPNILRDLSEYLISFGSPGNKRVLSRVG